MGYGERITILNRVISAASYMTAGIAGIVIFLILYIAKIKPSRFFTFNVYQSVFISFAIATLCMAYRIVYQILTVIPIIQKLMAWIDLILNAPFVFGYSVLQFVILVIFGYATLFCLLGRYPRIYKISNLFSRYI